jgi:hypothetical protein
MKSEIRNPKSEGSPNSEIRMGARTRRVAVRASGFGFLSDFEFRFSDFHCEDGAESRDGSRDAATGSPSPLNGERAGVRGGKAGRVRNCESRGQHHPSPSFPLPVEGRGRPDSERRFPNRRGAARSAGFSPLHRADDEGFRKNPCAGKIRGVLVVALCAFALLLSSCSTASRLSAKWEENPIDGPWTAPGVHAREFTRSYFAGLMHTSDATDTVWTTANGNRRDVLGTVDSVERYLKKLGYFDQWPETGSSSGGYTHRLAPFTFHIVAIDPTVVLMVPHDYGNPKGNRSTRDILGSQPKQAWGSRYMLNPIAYGTSLPYHPEILWFSPDLGSVPKPLTRRSDSEQELVHKRIRLVTKREGDTWTTRRE